MIHFLTSRISFMNEPSPATPPSKNPAVASEPALAAGTDAETGWVTVELGEVYEYSPEILVAELRGPDDTILPIWVTREEGYAILADQPGGYSPLLHTQDLLAGLINQMGGRVTEARLIPGVEDGALQCRLTVAYRGRELQTLCRPGDGALLARRFGARVLVETPVLRSHAEGSLPSRNWVVEAMTADGRVTVSRARFPVGVLLKAMPQHTRGWVVAGIVLALVGAAMQRGSMIGIGLIPVIQVLGTAVWLAILRETWLVADNALEVRRSVFGIRRTRRYVGARLYVTASSQPGTIVSGSGIVDRLWVVERGRSRRIASEEDGDDVHQMARFLALHTGWPLEETDAEKGDRKRV